MLSAAGSQECEKNLKLLLRLCERLGVLVAVHKVEGPTTIIVFPRNRVRHCAHDHAASAPATEGKDHRMAETEGGRQDISSEDDRQPIYSHIRNGPGTNQGTFHHQDLPGRSAPSHVINGLGNAETQPGAQGISQIKLRLSCPRLPVTPLIMKAIRTALEAHPGFESTMLWAACCVVFFFGFLQCGEFTSPGYDNRRNLSVSDDSHTNPTTIAIHLEVTKTDQFGAGTTVYLGRT